jgi:hypothetical protein
VLLGYRGGGRRLEVLTFHSLAMAHMLFQSNGAEMPGDQGDVREGAGGAAPVWRTVFQTQPVEPRGPA